jgi:hypothetical protein
MVPLFVQTDNIPTDVDEYLRKKNSQAATSQTSGGELSRDPSTFLKSMTSDGSVVWIDCTFLWKIVNVSVAVKNAMMILEVQDNDLSKKGKGNFYFPQTGPGKF